MLIQSKHLGLIEIDEEKIITFQEGIIGFSDIHRYILLGEEEGNPFQWLQAVDEPNLTFVVVPSKVICPTYKPKLNQDVLENLKIGDLEKVLFYSIVVLPEDISQMRTNLQSPLVINLENNKAKQVVLNQPEYKVRHYILQEMGEAKNVSAD